MGTSLLGSSRQELVTAPQTDHTPLPSFLQVLKRQGYDEGCDIWSLGILLYTMLAG